MNPDTNRLDPGFDLRIADWLEADPDRAPSEVLNTILAALPSVPQRRAVRMPWRLPTMVSPARIAAFVLVGMLAIAAILTSAVLSPRVTERPLPSGYVRFTSDLYPYSIGYPASWTVRRGFAASRDIGISMKGAVTVGSSADWLAPGIPLDGHGFGIAIGAVELRTGDYRVRPPTVSCATGDSRCPEAITIDGEQAQIIWNVNQGLAQATVVHNGWWFQFSTIAGDDATSRQTFKTLLSTVVFRTGS